VERARALVPVDVEETPEDTPKPGPGSANVRFVSANVRVLTSDTFLLVTSPRTVTLTLPPTNGRVLKISIHSAFANVTHFVKTSENDYFLSRDNDGKKSCRLGVDGKHIFVGQNNVWYLC